MAYLTTAALMMLALGLVLSRYSVNEAERFYARFLIVSAVIFAVMAECL